MDAVREDFDDDDTHFTCASNTQDIVADGKVTRANKTLVKVGKCVRAACCQVIEPPACVEGP